MSGKNFRRSNVYGQTETTYESTQRRRKCLFWKIFWLVCMLLILSFLWYRLFTKNQVINDNKIQSNETVLKVENEVIFLDGLIPESSQNYEDFNISNSIFNFQGQFKKFGDIFPEDSSFYDNLTEDDLESIKEGKILSINPQNISSDFYIDRKFISRKAQLFSMSWNYFTQKLTMTPNALEIINFDDILSGSKVFLLSDKSESGKTSTLKNFEMKLRSESDSWVSLIDLKHLEIDDLENKEEIKEFLSQNIPDKSSFEYFFDKEDMILLFDNVNRQNIKKSSNLFAKIQNLTNIQQIIATTPQLAEKLETTLNTNAFKFLPFNEDERENFIEQFLKTSNLNEEEREEIKNKILKFINKMTASGITNEERNIDSPFMIKMISKAALKNEKDFNFENSYQVYEEFVKEVWMREYPKEQNFKPLNKAHQHFALNLIMTNLYYVVDNYYSYQYEQNNIMDRISDLEIMQQTHHGKISSLITKNDDGSAEFPHLTIAEFFVAQYFIEHIYKPDNEVNHDEMEKRIEIFIFILKNSNFEIVQNFIADFLALQSDEMKFAKVVEKLMTKKFFNVALSFSDSESPEILYKFFEGDKIISESLGSSYDWMKVNFMIFTNTKIKFKQIWQLYVRNHQRGNILYQLWSKDEKIFNYLVKITQVDENLAMRVRGIESFEEFCDFMIANLTKAEQREAIMRNYPEMIGKFAIAEDFNKIWGKIENSEDLFTPLELTKIAFDPNWKNQTILSQCFNSNPNDHKIIQFIDTLKTSPEDIFKGLKAQLKSTKETSLMIASYKKMPQVNLKLLEYVEEKLDRKQLRELLKLENSQNFTVLQVSTFNLDSTVFEIYKNFIKKHLSKSEMREVLLTKNTEVKLYLLETLMWRHLPQCNAMIELLKEVFIDGKQKDKLREILKGRDEDGNTIFSGNLENFEDEIQPLIGLGEMIFDKQEMEELKVMKEENFVYRKIKFGENIWPE